MQIINYIKAKHNLIFKIGLICFFAFLIALMLPTKSLIGHKVDGFDAIWPYSDLILENDIVEEKLKSEIEQEKQEVAAKSPIVLEEIVYEKTAKLSKLEDIKHKDFGSYKIIKKLTDSLYQLGVIQFNDSTNLNKEYLLIKGNFAEAVDVNKLFTVEQAESFLIKNAHGKITPENAFNYIAPTIFVDEGNTAQILKDKLSKISSVKQIYLKGNPLVKRGDVLTNSKRKLINAYLNNYVLSNNYYHLKFYAGYAIIFFILITLLGYLAYFRKSIFGQNKDIVFIYLIILSSVFCAFLFYKFGFSLQALPYTLIPLLIRVFYDSRTALFTHLCTILVLSLFMVDKFEFILMQILIGIGTLFILHDLRRRQQIVFASLIVILGYIIVFASYQIYLGTPELVKKISAYVPFLVSGGLVMLLFPLIYLSELLFGFTSDFKLLELCDLNQPLLRKLAQEVPGTFQHSIQVANIAEEVIYYIGGNTLLVRAGAMYHDIGKIYNPRFFIENIANSYSPHIEMQPMDSAKIIINHVLKGVELAKEYKLPEQLVDFIRTHHGTTTVNYFYNIYKQNNPTADKTIEAEFKYKGPIPFSKETAILMLADAIEASSRSLKIYDAVSINDLVDGIIDFKITQQQLINSGITFKDLNIAKKIMKNRLLSIYHARIEYPSN